MVFAGIAREAGHDLMQLVDGGKEKRTPYGWRIERGTGENHTAVVVLTSFALEG